MCPISIKTLVSLFESKFSIIYLKSSRQTKATSHVFRKPLPLLMVHFFLVSSLMGLMLDLLTLCNQLSFCDCWFWVVMEKKTKGQLTTGSPPTSPDACHVSAVPPRTENVLCQEIHRFKDRHSVKS